MAKNKLSAADVTEDPHYHDTWTLLRKYRDVVWSLEVSVRQVRNRFRIDYGKTIEDFLESVYLAGADLSGTELEHQAKCIEQSHKMLCLVDSAVDLMRAKHKNGEEFYWLLYYAYLSPQELQNVEEIIDQLRPHIRDISTRTYYRKRKEAVEVLSSVLPPAARPAGAAQKVRRLLRFRRVDRLGRRGDDQPAAHRLSGGK